MIPSGIMMTVVSDIPNTIGASCQKWLTMRFCDVWIMHSSALSKVYTEIYQKNNSKFIPSGDQQNNASYKNRTSRPQTIS